MKLRYKRSHPDAVAPTRQKKGDAGYDLTAITKEVNKELGYIEYNTHIQVAIPSTHVGLIFPRSSCTKKNARLGNAVGVIDSNYRGDISFRFHPTLNLISLSHELSLTLTFETWYGLNKNLTEVEKNQYKVGERIGQLVVIPKEDLELEEVFGDWEETERGDQAYGSSGK